MKKVKASSKDKPNPMLHGQHEGHMPKEMKGKKESKGKLMHAKKKTAKKK